MPDRTVLGQNYPRVDAADKVSGRSQYASDVYLPGMLMCKVLQSPKPHARILHIDTSRAQGLPGVRAVITDLIDVTYEDLPAVTDPIAALRPDAPLVHEDLPSYEGYKPNMRGNICTVLDADRGDVDTAFA